MACLAIQQWDGPKIPDSVQLPPNILSLNLAEGDLSEAQRNTLEQNQSQSQRTTIEVNGSSVQGRVVSCVRSFTLRFFGPLSDYITLRLVHSSTKPGSYFIVNEDESYKHPIPCSDTLVLEDIKIWNTSAQRSRSSKLQILTFTPGSQNTLRLGFDAPTIMGSLYYALRDIKLLGQDGLPYQPADSGRGEEDEGLSYHAGASPSHIDPEATTKPSSP